MDWSIIFSFTFLFGFFLENFFVWFLEYNVLIPHHPHKLKICIRIDEWVIPLKFTG
jgi:hypothetical protein